MNVESTFKSRHLGPGNRKQRDRGTEGQRGRGAEGQRGTAFFLAVISLRKGLFDQGERELKNPKRMCGMFSQVPTYVLGYDW